MNKWLSSLLGIFLLANTVNAQALHRPEGTLDDFSAVSTAILSGYAVQIAVSFTDCEASNKNYLGNNLIGVVRATRFMFKNDDSLSTAVTHFTRADPRFPNASVLGHVRYTLKNDNTLTLIVDALNPVTSEPLADSVVVQCKLNQGAFISKTRN